MGHSLIKKHSKFLNLDEMFCCGMTRLKKMSLNYCGLCRYGKVIKSKKLVRLSLEFFYESIEISEFQYSIKFFTETWPSADTNNRKNLGNIFTQKLL